MPNLPLLPEKAGANEKPRFVTYSTGSEKIRARVLRRHRDGDLTVEPYFSLNEDGTDRPCFIGGKVRLPASHFAPFSPTLTIHQGDDYACIMRAGECTSTAFVQIHYPNADDMALIRQMAAAPDLLAALKAVVAVADRKTVEFDMARDAIAKAEGR